VQAWAHRRLPATLQVCSQIEHKTSEVEGEALSALDALTKKVMLGFTGHVILEAFLFNGQNYKFTPISESF